MSIIHERLNGRIKPIPIEKRFWKRVQITESCWNWLGYKEPLGYGRIRFYIPNVVNTQLCAHRFSYNIFKGFIPEGFHLDHLCRNPSCVNPSHLEPVTCRENILRGNGLPAKNAKKTHCKNGHIFSNENTVMRLDSKGRYRLRCCRICAKKRKRKPVIFSQAFEAP